MFGFPIAAEQATAPHLSALARCAAMLYSEGRAGSLE